MISLFSLTEDSISAFLPLLSESAKAALYDDDDVLAIGAAWDTKAAGIMLIRTGDEVNDLLYIAVAPAFRRKGVGTKLLEAACRVCDEEGVMLCGSYYEREGEDAFRGFFDAARVFTVRETEDYRCRLDRQDFINMKKKVANETASQSSFSIKGINELSANQVTEFENRLVDAEEMYIDFSDPALDNNLSLVVMKEDRIVAAIFFGNTDEESSELLFLWVEENDAKAFAAVMNESCEVLLVSDKDKLYVTAVTEKSRNMLEKYFPKREMVGRYYLVSWDGIPM